MPIDYSKWDHLDEYSDDDNEDNENNAATPRVTRLNSPSQVTFGGGDGSSASIIPSAKTADTTKSASPPVSSETNAISPNAAKKTIGSGDEYASWMTKGGSSVTASSDRRLFWSQDRYSVVIRLELVSKEEKIQAIISEGAVPYADRFCAVGTLKPQIHVHSTSGSVLLEGEVPHPIHYAQEEDGIEWSVERSCFDERFLTITLYKAVPMQGLCMWWRRPMMQFDEIEVKKEESSSSTSKEFLQAWEEAHRIFREKKRSSG